MMGPEYFHWLGHSNFFSLGGLPRGVLEPHRSMKKAMPSSCPVIERDVPELMMEKFIREEEEKKDDDIGMRDILIR